VQTVRYSDALTLVDQGFATQAQLETSEGHPQRVSLRLADHWAPVQAELPAMDTTLSQHLQQQGVPYGYTPATPWRRWLSGLGALCCDTLAPTLVFGVLAGGGLLASGKIRAHLAAQETEKILKEALSPISRPESVQSLLPLYEEPVRKSVALFQKGLTDALILKGPPGTGKSYLKDALAQELSADGKTMLLNLGVSVEVRQLLQRIYQGNALEAQNALQQLRRLHGKPFERILVTVDEVNAYQEEVEQLAMRAFGNPPAALRLPRPEPAGWLDGLLTLGRGSGAPFERIPPLKLLATANYELTLHPAVLNRLGVASSAWVGSPSPQLQSAFTQHWLARHAPQVALTEDPKALASSLEELFTEFPGYSHRSLSGILRQAVSGHPQGPDQPFLARLRGTLEATPLDGTEFNGLLHRMLLEEAIKRHRIKRPEARKLLAQSTWEVTLSHPEGDALAHKLGWNAKQYQQALRKIIRRLNNAELDPSQWQPAGLMKQATESLRYRVVMNRPKPAVEALDPVFTELTDPY
jgi:hypothetical protein